MEITFKNKKVLVTGAGRGIGRDIVYALHKDGAIIYALSKNKDNLESLKSECPGIFIIPCDLTNWGETEKCLADLPVMDHLVNNAGVAELAPFIDTTEELYDKVYNVNVKGLVNVGRIIAKKMVIEEVKGSIVNISSVSGQQTGMQMSIYCSTKAAVDMLTKCMAMELGPSQIRVNSVNPTIVMNDMGKQLWSDPARAQPVLNRIPLGRFSGTEEVVNATLFLLSDKASMSTGITQLVDGGYSIS